MWRVDPSQILIALVLDALIGDPRGWPHIARGAGWLSTACEKLLTARLRRSVTLGGAFWALVAGSMLRFTRRRIALHGAESACSVF
jgi:cobalamin biosynthesis protein CobD/CbiB